MKITRIKVWARVGYRLFITLCEIIGSLFVIGMLLFGAGSLVVRAAHWVHDYFRVSWNDTITGFIMFPFSLALFVVLALSVGVADALRDYFTDVVKRAEEEVKVEETIEGDRETLLRGTGKGG